MKACQSNMPWMENVTLEKSPLFMIVWRCTRACNLDCPYCSFASTSDPSPDELDTKGGKLVVDQIHDFGAEWFGISGGEPLYRRDLFEVTRHAKRVGLNISMITNGIYVDEKFNQIVRDEVYSSVSIDGSETTNDLLRGEGSYKKALRAVQRLSAVGLLDCITVTITKLNYHDLEHTVELAKEYKANAIWFHNFIPSGRAATHNNLAPTPEENEKILNHLYDLTEQYRGDVNINVYCPFYARIVQSRNPTANCERMCRVGKYMGVIENGDVVACGFSDLKIGNILQQPLREIWKTLQTSDFYKRLRNPENLQGKCGVCEYGSICGGCRTRSYVYTGDYFQSDPACSYIPQALREANPQIPTYTPS